jgi:branched-chain amino acid transport system substrate-binding protein
VKISTAVFVGAGLLVAGTALVSAQTKVRVPVRVAISAPFAGDLSNIGAQMKRSLDSVFNDIGDSYRKYDLKFEVSIFDDKNDPVTGATVAAGMINDDKILAVIGPINSKVAAAQAPILEKANMAMIITNASSPNLTEQGWSNVNRICGRDDVQGPIAADYAYNTMSLRRAFIVYDPDDYGRTIAESFRNRYRALGGTVVGFVTVNDVNPPKEVASQVKLYQPQLVYYAGRYPEAANLLKEMRAASVNSTFMGADGLDSSEFVRMAGPLAKGVLFTSFSGPILDFPKGKDFSDLYKAYNGGVAPEPYALYAYDAVNAFVKAFDAALKANGNKIPSRVQIRDAIRKVSFDGASGKIEFDEKGDRKIAQYFIMQFADAKYPGKTMKSLPVRSPSNKN